MSSESIKILIAEDDSFLRNMYLAKLESEDFEVVLASDGEEALDKMKIEKPDIVLLDLLMPKKDGFQVLEEKSSNSEIKDIPVIILSNLSQSEKIKRCYALGAKDFLIKAYFVPAEVIEKIKNLISK